MNRRYNPNKPELLQARHRARCAVEDYNKFSVKDVPYDKVPDARFALLKNVVGKAGSGTLVEPPFNPDYGCNIVIGSDTYINFKFGVLSMSKSDAHADSFIALDTSLVVIGDRVQLGPNVGIYTVGHDTSVLSRRKFVEFGHPVRIGDDCWIGGNVIILPGVTIGEGSTVGAGSVVTKDIPPFSVALGSPCKVKGTVQSAEEEERDPNNPYRNMVRDV